MNENGEFKNLYSMWYDFSNGIGKQFLDMSNLGNLNYAKLQDSWKGYSERINDQIYQLMNIDGSYYKDVMKLWSEFSENMNDQISKIKMYDKSGPSNWYDYWLDYSDRISRDISNAIQKQFDSRSELYEMNELWLNKFGFNDDQKQRILETSKILYEYWFDVMKHANDLINESSKLDRATELPKRFQEFFEYWSKSYSNLIEHLMEITPIETWRDYNPKEDLNLFSPSKQSNSNINHEEIEDLKQKVKDMAEAIEEFKNEVSSKNTSGRRGRRR
jgi:hypothetical protein